MIPEGYDDNVEGLKALAHDLFQVDGEWPDRAGMVCIHCGLGVEVPFEEIDDLDGMMAAHVELCPRKPCEDER